MKNSCGGTVPILQSPLSGGVGLAHRARLACPRVVKHAAAATAILALAACAHKPVQIQTVEVKVPVAVHPIVPAQVPVVPGPLQQRPDNLAAAADMLLAQVCRLSAYVVRADPLLRASAGLPATGTPYYPECSK